MNILEKIKAVKKKELGERKELVPISQLEKATGFGNPAFSLRRALLIPDSSGIIAEFKRKSPSKGIINDDVSVAEVTGGYLESGAAALSVLTDNPHFGGSLEDFMTARKMNDCPIIRKEFIIDEYQVYESRAVGTDVILLIAAMLDKQRTRDLAALATQMNMEVLLEIHGIEELNHLNEYVDLVGVNNRNLKDFRVDVRSSIDLCPLIPGEFVRIAESGISQAKTIAQLRDLGYRGFLIGEYFMRSTDPAQVCRRLIDQVNKYERST